MLKRYRLLIPGPTDVAMGVLEALAAPVVAHYGEEWVAEYHATLKLLQQVFQTEQQVFILPGSGTTGIEACMLLLAGPGDEVIVGVNGAFGDRLVEMCRLSGYVTVHVESEWGEPLAPERIAERLDTHPRASFVCLVHNETSTGVVNPIDAISQVCRSAGVPLLVDAVSSLGGIELRMDEWGLTACAAASQKCLESPPGLSVVCVADEAWSLAEKKQHPRGFYLNLLNWREKAEKMADWHPYPLTQPTNNILALQQSLQCILNEGLAQRFERHITMARKYRAGLEALGFRIFASPDCRSPVTTTAMCPEGVDPATLRQRLRQEHRLLVAHAQGRLANKAFRIGHFGLAASEEYLWELLTALHDIMQ